MSSWLNFNDSFNTIKGQITNFATTVLADDEDNDISQKSNEELKERCKKLQDTIQELLFEIEAKNVKNGDISKSNPSGDSWDWKGETSSQKQDENLDDIITNLRKQIAELENEKTDFVNQLEQLDTDNQQNIAEIMVIKDKLQEENYEFKEKCEQLQQINKKLTSREAFLKKSLDESKMKRSEDTDDNQYQSLIEENQKLKAQIEEFEKSTLKDSKEESLMNLQAENKIIYAELQNAKQNISQFEKKSIEDTENCAKLTTILESYEKQVSALKEELSNCTQDKSIREELENTKISYETQITYFKAEQDHLKANLENISQKFNDLLQEHDKLLSKNDEVHKKYVNIVTKNVKRYLDGEKHSDLEECDQENDPKIKEFNKQVENILEILLDFKCKCEELEKEVYELSQEKNKILSEKNYEIEKLMQNSEMLSQELMSKSQIVKEYENECTELEKNNELLIKELDTYKNNSGLQTISESNEDNVLLLESQLENAQKRIIYLEGLIDEYGKNKKTTPESVPLEITKELEKRIVNMENESENQLNASMKKLEITESEVDNKSKEFQDLLNRYDNLIIENEGLKEDLKAYEDDLEVTRQENEELTSSLDKTKTDYENSDYQLTEVNINLEGLKEELESCKKEIENLLNEKKSILIKQNDSDNNNENIRAELNFIREQLLMEEDSRKQAEGQIRTLTEKLQNAKMAETTLKLQYDALNKELVVIAEAKHTLEEALANTTAEIQKFESNYLEMQKQNDNLRTKLVEMENKMSEKEQQLLNMENLIKELEEKSNRYENIAIEENEELLKKLTITPNNAENITSMEVDLENKSVDINAFNNMHLESVKDLKEQLSGALREKDESKAEVIIIQTRLQETQAEYEKLRQTSVTLEKEFEKLNVSRNELINIVKAKDQESLTYYNEIQRLTQILRTESEKSIHLEAQLNEARHLSTNNEEIQKLKQANEKLTDQNNFLKQKCEVLAENLLQEQAKVHTILSEKPSTSEKEHALLKELDRLKSHLIEVEENLTQELVEAEQKNAELLGKVKNIEEKEKNSSTMYTSISIRANQQVEVLQKQVQSLTNQREELRKRISDAEDENNKQAAALANLQFVLEQFQKDKEKDVHKETERIRRQINAEKLVQEDLKRDIHNLKQQLEESKQGLQAAARLSEQLELSKRLSTSLKEEVTQLQNKLEKSENTIKNLTSQTDGKVEKSLIKNLIIGYVSSNANLNKDQSQILKIIATVLDFNQQDHDKVKSKAQQGSWLGSLLAPQTGESLTQESLSQAFVKFLENESKPRVVPSLLGGPTTTASPSASNNSKNSTPRQSPIVLSEIVLPTFADFAQNRNSSSILKDVLKDSTNSS